MREGSAECGRHPDQSAGRTGAITQPLDPSQRFYLDLHSHSSDGSDDAGATVEGYLRWIAGRRRLGYRIDGFVLTEHRNFDLERDYSALAEQYDVVLLRGVEVETDIGHVLVFGAGPSFYRDFDLTDVNLPYQDVFRAVRDSGGIAVGAHAGRPRIGVAEHAAQRGVSLEGIEVIEALNGGSSDAENAIGLRLADEHGLRRVGGSDAHFVSGIGRCLTAFPGRIDRIEALVEALRGDDYYPVMVEETHDDPEIRARSRRALAAEAEVRSAHHDGDGVEWDESTVGVEVPVGEVEITLDQITAYCEATGERSALYRADSASSGPYGGVIAPPGLLQSMIQGRGPDPKVKFGNTQFMAGSRLENYAPVRPGDVISGHASVKEVYVKTGRSGTMVFVVNRLRYSNQRGEDVAAVETSLVHRQVQPRGE